jgi:hypothetical protein
MSEEIESLERSLDALTDRLGRLHSSDPLSARNGLESKYGRTYQQLVKLGVKPQIRQKYRGNS